MSGINQNLLPKFTKISQYFYVCVWDDALHSALIKRAGILFPTLTVSNLVTEFSSVLYTTRKMTIEVIT